MCDINMCIYMHICSISMIISCIIISIFIHNHITIIVITTNSSITKHTNTNIVV